MSEAKPLQYFPGTEPRVTVLDLQTGSETYPIETKEDGYVGERGMYNEPTLSITIRATGVPAELGRELLAVVRKLQAAVTQ